MRVNNVCKGKKIKIKAATLVGGQKCIKAAEMNAFSSTFNMKQPATTKEKRKTKSKT